jgi:hypothetical protein
MGSHLERIPIEDHEIGQLALLERAFACLLAILISRSGGHRLQALVGADALIRPDRLARAGNAVHRRPEHEQLIERRRHEIGVPKAQRAVIYSFRHSYSLRGHLRGWRSRWAPRSHPGRLDRGGLKRWDGVRHPPQRLWPSAAADYSSLAAVVVSIIENTWSRYTHEVRHQDHRTD